MDKIKISMEGLKPFIYSLAYVSVGDIKSNKPLNVGLIVYCLETGEVAYRQSGNQAEIFRVTDESTLEMINDFFSNLEQSIQPYLLLPGTRMQAYPDWLTALATEKTGSLRFSMPLDVISVSIEEAFLELSRQYLEDKHD